MLRIGQHDRVIGDGKTLMQTLDAVTLKAVAGEWREMLAHSRVQKIYHPSAREFLLTFWGGAVRAGGQRSGRDLLYIHLGAEAPCVFLADSQERQQITLQTFDKPTALCMGLRKRLHGASFLMADTLPGERVLNLHFENDNELGQRVRLMLSLELMGKHSNMLLVDKQTGDLLAVAHGVSERMSQYRELAAGLPYAPPPFPAGKRLVSTMSIAAFCALYDHCPPEEPMAMYLNRQLAGWGRAMLAAVLAECNPSAPHAGERVYQALCDLESGRNLRPAIRSLSMEGGASKKAGLLSGSEFTLCGPPGCGPPGASPVEGHEKSTEPMGWRVYATANDMVADYFQAGLRTSRLHQRRTQIQAMLARRVERMERRAREMGLAGLSDCGDAASDGSAASERPNDREASEIAQWQATGDRLLAAYSAGEVPSEGPMRLENAPVHSVTLSRYEDGSPWVIPIDPTLGWVENARLYYRRAKKAKARQVLRVQMAGPLRDTLDFLETLRQLATCADTLAELNAIELDVAMAGLQDRMLPGEGLGDVSGNTISAKKLTGGKKANGKAKHPKAKRHKKEAGNGDAAWPSGVVRVQSSDGLEILLGKSAQANDALVGRLSRSTDYWLHVHQMPGSHVLIRLGALQHQTEQNHGDDGGEGDDNRIEHALPKATLEEAAMLAAYYSAARHSVNVPVTYTQSRYVRKIPHSYPGHVTYRQEKTLFITPDPARLTSLLGVTSERLE